MISSVNYNLDDDAAESDDHQGLTEDEWDLVPDASFLAE